MMQYRRLLKAFGNRLVWFLKTLILYFFRLFPIRLNKVFIVNYYGKGYGDNPKYICEQLIKNEQKLEIVWAVNNISEKMPSNIRKVEYESFRYYYDLCTSKIWIDNCRKPIYVRKRNEQFYIQTWHGDLAIKKIEKDAIKSLYKSYIKAAINDSKMADVCLSGNKWFEQIYKNAMWFNGTIEKYGYPRRDILYTVTEQRKERIKKNAGIPSGYNLILYAPTFRKKQTEPDLSVYNIDWEQTMEALEARFGGQWIALIRLHPNISKYSSRLMNSTNVMDVTSYPDMQELLAISDACISDYSSSILDFGVTKKPGFIFALDYDEYRNDRDVYFDLHDLPFPIAFSNQELIQRIKNFDMKKYIVNLNHFYEDVIGMYEDGHASINTANLISKKTLSNSSTTVSGDKHK